MSLGRLNNPLYDERGQFIGNQQPEANMFYGFNPTGAIGTGVSSGNIPAVANPLDSAPAGGGKGGGKGGGFTPPPPQNMYGGVGYNSYMGAGGIRPTSVPTQFSGFNAPTTMPRGGMIPLPETNFPLPFTPSPPSAGKGGGKGGGTPPPAPSMSAGTGKGGGKGGGMPTRPTPTGQFAGTAPDGSFNPPTSYGSPPAVSGVADAINLSAGFGGPSGSPAPAGGGKGGGKGGEIPDSMKEYAGSIGQPRTPPAGGGMFGGLANAANLFNQQRQRNDFINSDNELNRIRGAQMELERKARQEAKNRSYYDQPAEPQPTGASNLSDQEVIDYYTNRGEMVAMPSSPEFAKKAMDELRARMPADLSQPPAPVQPNLRTMPASRNPYDRQTMDSLNAAYQERMESFQDPRRLAMLEAMRNMMPRTTFASPEDEQRLRNQLGMPEPQPDSDYQLQQQNFLKTRRLLNELADPAPGMRGQRPQPSIGAGLNTSGLAALLGGGNPFMR